MAIFSPKPTRSRRKPGVTERARTLRQADNEAEAAMWNVLKAKRLGGHKFVRQFPIGPYYADFVCRSKRLVVEIDGSQHVDSTYDRSRDKYMSDSGYSVLRFWSVDVLKKSSAVGDTIIIALEGRLTSDIAASDLRFTRAMAKEIES